MIQKASRPSGENHLISDHSLSADILVTLAVTSIVTKTAREIGAEIRVISVYTQVSTYLLQSESVRQGMDIFMILARLWVTGFLFQLHGKKKSIDYSENLPKNPVSKDTGPRRDSTADICFMYKLPLSHP